MKTKVLLGALVAAVIVSPALAQSTKSSESTKAEVIATHSNMWRASKLKGLNVYNDQNEKLGDISELLIDKSGKVEGVVIGVGGFLGMGEHDIKVEMSKLKFVDEPVRVTASTTTTKSDGTNTGPGTPATQRATVNEPASTTGRSEREWYPDHALLSGVSKDQLKGMPQFKYE